LIPFTTFRKQGNQNHLAPIWRKNGSLFLFVEGIRAQKWKRQGSCEDNIKGQRLRQQRLGASGRR